MTPAINLPKKKKVLYTFHQYQNDSSEQYYGLEAAKKLITAMTDIKVILAYKETYLVNIC